MKNVVSNLGYMPEIREFYSILKIKIKLTENFDENNLHIKCIKCVDKFS